MTEAEETVEDSEILSVDIFIRELNRDAARDFFLVCTVAVDSPSSSSCSVGTDLPEGDAIPEEPEEGPVTSTLPLGRVSSEARTFPSLSSSASLRTPLELNDNARRKRPLRPLLRTVEAPGVESSMAARSMSSRDMRFSEAVKLPCDKGEGRIGRACGAVVPLEEFVGGGEGLEVGAREGVDVEAGDALEVVEVEEAEPVL